MPIVVKSNTKKYIHFNDNGNILAITNQPSEEQYIVVDSKDIVDLIKGIVPTHEYRVEFDLAKKDYVLNKYDYWEEARTTDSFLHKITNNNDADATIVQDNKSKQWKLVLSKKILENVKKVNVNLENLLKGYSVTDENNPYKLHYILNFDKDNLTIPYPDNFQFDKSPVSVYTIKKLESYSHEVIND
jgi:hypothetical protein